MIFDKVNKIVLDNEPRLVSLILNYAYILKDKDTETDSNINISEIVFYKKNMDDDNNMKLNFKLGEGMHTILKSLICMMRFFARGKLLPYCRN